MVKKYQDNNFSSNKSTYLDSVVVNRTRTSDKDLANKKYVNDSLAGGNILRFNQPSDNYLKLSAQNDVYNLTKNDKIQFTDTTIFKNPNSGGFLLQKWNINCNNKKIDCEIQSFVRSRETSSPKGNSGATSLPPIRNLFMYIGASQNISGEEIFFLFHVHEQITFSWVV